MWEAGVVNELVTGPREEEQGKEVQLEVMGLKGGGAFPEASKMLVC